MLQLLNPLRANHIYKICYFWAFFKEKEKNNLIPPDVFVTLKFNTRWPEKISLSV